MSDSDLIERAANAIYDSWEGWADGGRQTDYCQTIARDLAAAGLLVTPEQQAVLDAAEAWMGTPHGDTPYDPDIQEDVCNIDADLYKAVADYRASRDTHTNPGVS